MPALSQANIRRLFTLLSAELRQAGTNGESPCCRHCTSSPPDQGIDWRCGQANSLIKRVFGAL
jgi:hypothetical protein